jgi:hypothetical protein
MNCSNNFVLIVVREVDWWWYTLYTHWNMHLCLGCTQVISKAVSWVLKHQTWDGAFYEVTWCPDRKMNNSLVWPDDHVKFRNISLTAHVLIMLETVKDLTGVSCRAASWRSLKVLISCVLGMLIVSYGCETWSVIQREDHIFMVFEIKLLRNIFQSMRGKMTRDLRNLHNVEPYNLCS